MDAEVIAWVEAAEEKAAKAFKAEATTRATEGEAKKALDEIKEEVKFLKA